MVTAHNRYLVYEMLGREVQVHRPGENASRFGFVDRVLRDIFRKVIVIVIDGRSRTFKEPNAMIRHGDDILFVYGDVETQDDDAAMFSALRESYSENLYDVIERASTHPCKVTRFVLRDSSTKKRKLRRDSFHR